MERVSRIRWPTLRIFSSKLSLANLCRIAIFMESVTSVYAVAGFFPAEFCRGRLVGAFARCEQGLCTVQHLLLLLRYALRGTLWRARPRIRLRAPRERPLLSDHAPRGIGRENRVPSGGRPQASNLPPVAGHRWPVFQH